MADIEEVSAQQTVAGSDEDSEDLVDVNPTDHRYGGVLEAFHLGDYPVARAAVRDDLERTGPDYPGPELFDIEQSLWNISYERAERVKECLNKLASKLPDVQLKVEQMKPEHFQPGAYTDFKCYSPRGVREFLYYARDLKVKGTGTLLDQTKPPYNVVRGEWRSLRAEDGSFWAMLMPYGRRNWHSQEGRYMGFCLYVFLEKFKTKLNSSVKSIWALSALELSSAAKYQSVLVPITEFVDHLDIIRKLPSSFVRRENGLLVYVPNGLNVIKFSDNEFVRDLSSMIHTTNPVLDDGNIKCINHMRAKRPNELLLYSIMDSRIDYDIVICGNSSKDWELWGVDWDVLSAFKPQAPRVCSLFRLEAAARLVRW